MRFNGQVVVVTGAARSIGRAVAEAFAAEGARVFGADVCPGPET
ncbi:MAG TPA: SDR family NAD(P)-dependent oxidoreductase [Symbiobacteriaceae bacterium]|jgi:NAD(P)-dependent dehydrogenase (short-subunit alcohol dehydrogenase family)